MKTFLLFDIDGTLLFSNSIDSQCFAESYQAVFDRPFPSIDWRAYPHVTDHVIFRTVFTRHFDRSATPEERSRFETHYVNRLETERERQPESFMEVPGARKCWEHLIRDNRFVLGIATGGWHAPAQVKLGHVGIDPIPPYAAYADGMETRDQILQTAIDLARTAHDIDRVVYLGDAIWDVTTTRRMNLPLIGVRRKGDDEVLRREGVQTILNNYEDMDRVFAAIEGVKDW